MTETFQESVGPARIRRRHKTSRARPRRRRHAPPLSRASTHPRAPSAAENLEIPSTANPTILYFSIPVGLLLDPDLLDCSACSRSPMSWCCSKLELICSLRWRGPGAFRCSPPGGSISSDSWLVICCNTGTARRSRPALGHFSRESHPLRFMRYAEKSSLIQTSTDTATPRSCAVRYGR
eukprot:6176605-Pleurochrysis_carterae.AAC.2